MAAALLVQFGNIGGVVIIVITTAAAAAAAGFVRDDGRTIQLGEGRDRLVVIERLIIDGAGGLLEDLHAHILCIRRGQRDIARCLIERQGLVELQILGHERAVILLLEPLDIIAVDHELIKI